MKMIKMLLNEETENSRALLSAELIWSVGEVGIGER